MQSQNDKTSRIISVFNDCQIATNDMVYFPVSKIGIVVQTALAMRKSLDDCYHRIERLEKELAALKKPPHC